MNHKLRNCVAKLQYVTHTFHDRKEKRIVKNQLKEFQNRSMQSTTLGSKPSKTFDHACARVLRTELDIQRIETKSSKKKYNGKTNQDNRNDQLSSLSKSDKLSSDEFWMKVKEANLLVANTGTAG
jgi:hypothetical protein